MGAFLFADDLEDLSNALIASALETEQRVEGEKKLCLKEEEHRAEVLNFGFDNDQYKINQIEQVINADRLGVQRMKADGSLGYEIDAAKKVLDEKIDDMERMKKELAHARIDAFPPPEEEAEEDTFEELEEMIEEEKEEEKSLEQRVKETVELRDQLEAMEEEDRLREEEMKEIRKMEARAKLFEEREKGMAALAAIDKPQDDVEEELAKIGAASSAQGTGSGAGSGQMLPVSGQMLPVSVRKHDRQPVETSRLRRRSSPIPSPEGESPGESPGWIGLDIDIFHDSSTGGLVDSSSSTGRGAGASWKESMNDLSKQRLDRDPLSPKMTKLLEKASKPDAFQAWANPEAISKGHKDNSKNWEPPDRSWKYVVHEEEKELSYWDRNNSALCCFPPDSSFRAYCRALYTDPTFEGFIIGVIILNSIFMAFERPGMNKDGAEYKMMEFMGLIFVVIFSIEFWIKCIAEGMFIGPNAYFRDPWNRLDGSLVWISWGDLLLKYVMKTDNPIVRLLRVLRMLRAMRPLRSINRIPMLKTIVRTILSSVEPISQLLVLFMVIFCVFGILSIQLFGGKLYYCQGNNNVDTKAQCEAYCKSSSLTLTLPVIGGAMRSLLCIFWRCNMSMEEQPTQFR